jgi:hypothetical protein
MNIYLLDIAVRLRPSWRLFTSGCSMLLPSSNNASASDVSTWVLTQDFPY